MVPIAALMGPSDLGLQCRLMLIDITDIRLISNKMLRQPTMAAQKHSMFLILMTEN